ADHGISRMRMTLSAAENTDLKAHAYSSAIPRHSTENGISADRRVFTVGLIGVGRRCSEVTTPMPVLPPAYRERDPCRIWIRMITIPSRYVNHEPRLLAIC